MKATHEMKTLRHLEAEDYPAIIAVVDAWWGGRHMADMLPRLFFVHFRPTSFVLEENGEIHGFLVGMRSQTISSQAYIHFVGSDPRYRRQGIGRQLYQHFFEVVARTGCTEIFCITSPANKGSIAFHTHMGFEILPGDAEVDGVAVTSDYDGRGSARVCFRLRLHPQKSNAPPETHTYLSTTWYDPRIEVQPSPIYGKGLFVTHPIHAGETLAIMGGNIVSTATFRTSTDANKLYNAIQIDEDMHLVELPTPIQKIQTALNHSCDSNLWMRDEVTLVARRDIAAGEELTIDYALFNTGPDWTLDRPCNCGSSLCRQLITGSDWQRPDIQVRYHDHFSPFINKRIQTH